MQLQDLIDILTDLNIDLDGEDDTMLTGFRLDLEDLKDASPTHEAILNCIEEFENDWLEDISDKKVKAGISEVLVKYKQSGLGGK
jgi:hypothetical protein